MEDVLALVADHALVHGHGVVADMTDEVADVALVLSLNRVTMVRMS